MGNSFKSLFIHRMRMDVSAIIVSNLIFYLSEQT